MCRLTTTVKGFAQVEFIHIWVRGGLILKNMSRKYPQYFISNIQEYYDVSKRQAYRIGQKIFNETVNFAEKIKSLTGKNIIDIETELLRRSIDRDLQTSVSMAINNPLFGDDVLTNYTYQRMYNLAEKYEWAKDILNAYLQKQQYYDEITNEFYDVSTLSQLNKLIKRKKETMVDYAVGKAGS